MQLLFCKLSQNEHGACSRVFSGAAWRRCGFTGPRWWWQRALSVRLYTGNRCHSGDFQVLYVSANVSTYSLKTTINTGYSTMRLFLWLQFSIKERKMVPNMLMDSRNDELSCLVCSLGNNVGNITSRLNHLNRNEYSESQQLYGSGLCSKTQCLH